MLLLIYYSKHRFRCQALILDIMQFIIIGWSMTPPTFLKSLFITIGCSTGNVGEHTVNGDSNFLVVILSASYDPNFHLRISVFLCVYL